MKKHNLTILVAVLGFLVLTIGSVGAVKPDRAHGSSGAVYIMTNDPAGNQVIAYNRAANGGLAWAGTFSTMGLGASGLTGSNQGGLTLSRGGTWLLVVNAGSNDVSVFRVSREGLTLTDKVGSGGTMPISVTIHDNWVYALDAGTSSSAGNIAGFYLSHRGELTPIPGSVQPLSGIAAPAQVSFNPDGRVLAVTEKSTRLINTYTVSSRRVAKGPSIHASSGGTPFGFAFDRAGDLIVSEAAGGPSGTSAVSSYDVSSAGALTTISASVPDTQQAACWLVVTGNGRYAYTTNAHSQTISSYSIASNGAVSLLNPVAANVGGADLDLARNSRFLYVFNNGQHSIVGYKVHADGSLEWMTAANGVPAGADGLAAI